jgi:hypothetical protein
MLPLLIPIREEPDWILGQGLIILGLLMAYISPC